jgi:hypothetical protein
MSIQFTAEQLFKMTIEKAIREDKHPLEVLEEVKKLIEQKRTMERQRIKQADSGKGSVN